MDRTPVQTESSNVTSADSPKPTAEVRKFMFDRSFDEDVEPAGTEVEEAEAEAPAEEAEPEVVAPTFSEEEMKAARDEAFAAGKEEGAADAKASTEREIKVSLEGVVERLKGVGEAQDKANASVLETAVIVAVGIARKLFPTLNEKHALAEIERMVGLAMDRVLEEPKVVVYVNDKLKAPLAERVAGLVAKAKFKGEMIVEGVDDIIVGDCRVEWMGGGARRNMDELWQEVDVIVEHNLADDSKTAAAVATEIAEPGQDIADAAQPDAEPETEDADAAQPDAPPAPEAAAGSEAEIEAEPETEAPTDAVSETETEPEAEAEPETETETKAEADSPPDAPPAPEATPDAPGGDGDGDDTPTDREDR